MMGWRDILGEMGMAVTSSILPVGRIGGAFDADGRPAGEDGARLEKAFPRFADDLGWWIDAAKAQRARQAPPYRSEEHTSELQSLMRISYAVFCLKKKTRKIQ